MQSPANLLLPALLFTVIGIVIGVVVVLLIVDRTRGKKEEKGEPEKPAAADEGVPGLPADRFDPVARLFRERTSGRLVVEVDKKIYLTPDSAPAKVLDDLKTSVESLTTWLGLTTAPVQPPEKVEITAQLEPPAAFTPASPAASAKAAAGEPPRATSIVGQINDILQEILAESDYADHKVSLIQESSMGVIVWVDGVKYSGIDSVPDAGAKELIKRAVKTWERKNDLSRRYP